MTDTMWRGGPISVASGQTEADALREYRAQLAITYTPPNFATTCMQIGYVRAYHGEPITDDCQRTPDAACTCGAQTPIDATESLTPFERVPDLSDAEWNLINEAQRLDLRHKTTAKFGWRHCMSQLTKLALSQGPLSALGEARNATRGKLYRSLPQEWQAVLDALAVDETLAEDEHERVKALALFGLHYSSRRKGKSRAPTSTAYAAREMADT